MKAFSKNLIILSSIWLILPGYFFTNAHPASGNRGPFPGPTEVLQTDLDVNTGVPIPQVSGRKGLSAVDDRPHKDKNIVVAENPSKSYVSQKTANKITGIRFEVLYSEEERVIISGTGISPPKIFALEGENPRVVCDFKGMDLSNSISRKISTKGKFIKMIRTALYKAEGGKVRVVLDLSPERSYEVEQTFYKNKDAYELIIKPEKPMIR